MPTLEDLFVAKKVRELLNEVAPIELQHLTEYHQRHFRTDSYFPSSDVNRTSYVQYCKQIRKLSSGRPAAQLMKAVDSLFVRTKTDWLAAKQKLWGAYHRYCDSLAIYLNANGEPIVGDRVGAFIVPSRLMEGFSFRTGCFIDSWNSPGPPFGLKESHRDGVCRHCDIEIRVASIDPKVLQRVFRECIIQVRNEIQSPETPIEVAAADALQSELQPSKWPPQLELKPSEDGTPWKIKGGVRFCTGSEADRALNTEHGLGHERALAKALHKAAAGQRKGFCIECKWTMINGRRTWIYRYKDAEALATRIRLDSERKS